MGIAASIQDFASLPLPILSALLGIVLIVWIVSSKDLVLGPVTLPQLQRTSSKLIVGIVAVPFWAIAIVMLVHIAWPPGPPVNGGGTGHASKLSLTPCSMPSDFGSGAGPTLTLNVTNSSGGQRTIYWLKSGGAKQLMATLRHKEKWSFQTYADDVWEVDDVSKNCVGQFVIGTASTENITL